MRKISPKAMTAVNNLNIDLNNDLNKVRTGFNQTQPIPVEMMPRKARIDGRYTCPESEDAEEIYINRDDPNLYRKTYSQEQVFRAYDELFCVVSALHVLEPALRCVVLDEVEKMLKIRGYRS